MEANQKKDIVKTLLHCIGNVSSNRIQLGKCDHVNCSSTINSLSDNSKMFRYIEKAYSTILNPQYDFNFLEATINNRFDEEKNDFAMVYFKYSNFLNWEKYYNSFGKIEFLICANPNVYGITFQLKSGSSEHKNEPDCIEEYIPLDNVIKLVSIPLKFTYDSSDLASIEEICFTVFKKHVKNLNEPAKFCIINLQLVHDYYYDVCYEAN